MEASRTILGAFHKALVDHAMVTIKRQGKTWITIITTLLLLLLAAGSKNKPKSLIIIHFFCLFVVLLEV